jgi:hypothetical protein
MPEKKRKNPMEVAMEKDCIILVAGSFIIRAIGGKEISVKCLGPGCGQYDTFTHVCGFSK